MSTGLSGDFLAADVYPKWRARVKDAQSSVRIFTPYLGQLLVHLLGHSHLDESSLSVVTDLSPASGTMQYRAQLLAIKRLLQKGVEVRSLPRLHAKVLLIDGTFVTVGSQNFTSYARDSHETTAVPSQPVDDLRFHRTLNRWYDAAAPVDLVLIERLLDELAAPLDTATTAVSALIAAFDDVEAAYREERRQAEITRFDRDLAESAARPTQGHMRIAAVDSPSFAGQSVAYARLEWQAGGYESLERSSRETDLTAWRASRFGNVVRLRPLAFYPVLLGPDGQMAFVRVGKSVITYVWRGVRWGTRRWVGGRLVHLNATFPDGAGDGCNLALKVAWTPDSPSGYEFRLRFDGTAVLPVAEGRRIGDGAATANLAEIAQSAYEDEDAWNQVLRDVFSPAENPRGFLHEKNAASFFPRGWLRVDHTKFLDESVLLVQPWE